MQIFDINDVSAGQLRIPVRATDIPEVQRQPGEIWSVGVQVFFKSADGTVLKLRALTDQDLGEPNGVAPLDTTGTVPLANLPASIGGTGGGAASGSLLPPGTIIDYAGTSSTPAGYLECDGSAVSRTFYAALFAAIDVVWGSGNGSTTFNLPDLRRRTTIGAGGVASAVIGHTTGNVGGEETHILTTTEIPSHTHTYDRADGGDAGVTAQGTNDGTSGILTSSTGGDGAHNNMQPSAVVRKLIKT